MKFKGPVFPSYLNQQTPRAKRQWLAHCGKRAQMRNLRQVCRPILESRDPAVQREVARVIEATKNEPFAEFGKLHLIHAAQDACDQTGEPWAVCMKYLMDKFEDMKNDKEESARAVPPPDYSIRRVLTVDTDGQADAGAADGQ